ncbi:DsbA family protein [Novosphingobium panipatense]|uniref:DsbA family protein n=1 Tax=Novosphingobium panipatense TaxID=428991 RepID=UPI0036091E4E
MSAIALVAGVAVLRAGDDGAHAQSATGSVDAQASAEGERIRHEIQNDPVAPTVAPQGYDVTIVVFSDYQCPYCRKVHPALEALLREDKKVKLVYRDWPIFGAPSTEAARAAIASQYQGKHAAFNDALMQSQGKLSSESIRAAADRAGVDWARLQRI